VWLSRRHGFGLDDRTVRPPVWQAFKGAIWGLLAPVIILGGMRSGAFTPTEAAVVAVAYGAFVGMVVYRTMGFRDLYDVLAESAEISAVVLLIIGLASVFGYAGSTLGAFDALAHGILGLNVSPWSVLLLVNLMLLVAGMFLDAVSIYLIMLPLLVPLMRAFQWDPVWFGVMMTMNLAIGQFTPPLAVNLMVTGAVAKVSMESTVRWVLWFVAAMTGALLLVMAIPDLVLWLPRRLGY
ncbi:MAG TPA: TRAP transporter large permease subunit, partial [Skermanella sp.]|nr:TRAP transporter large permease subunit [Skermanella sp.]